MTSLSEETLVAIVQRRPFAARMLDLLVAMTELGHRPAMILAHADLARAPGKRDLGGVEWRFEDGTRVIWRRTPKVRWSQRGTPKASDKLAWSYVTTATALDAAAPNYVLDALRAIAHIVPGHLLKSEVWREPPTPGGSAADVQALAATVVEGPEP